ncbi:MAG: hypothetical protein J1F64_04300, partial [Oscillospiraceae bacterium]|nr:hypothetical protein [Oscillospiraceae bacterium]
KMTDFEMLQAIFDEMKKMNQRLDNIETKVDNLERDNKAINEKLDNLETKVDELEKEVKRNTFTLETTVKQCVDMIGEGYQANFEKIDSLNLDSMKSQINRLEMLYKFTASEIELLKIKIG